VGVCWRLACALARHGDTVRLAIDDARALAWMAPTGQAGVQVCAFDAPAGSAAHAAHAAADVVVEAFGCDPPPAYVQGLISRAPPPVWINLEHLSAEDYVERSHALPSPQPGGLLKWFYYPGFTARTGGLLREPDLPARRAAFAPGAWLARHAVPARAGERVVSLFCYDNPALPALLDLLAAQPTLLLTTPGPAQQQVQALLQRQPLPPGLRASALPWLPQPAFDELLWASDLAFVRGEDSLVRALWAGVPFVWQAYPQHDGVHARKLQALLQRMALPADAAALWAAWNGLAPMLPRLPDHGPGSAWATAAGAWSAHLLAQPDLATQLRGFVCARRS
jgi:uncharacterized repeat protein (TIGR03837 family)